MKYIYLLQLPPPQVALDRPLHRPHNHQRVDDAVLVLLGRGLRIRVRRVVDAEAAAESAVAVPRSSRQPRRRDFGLLAPRRRAMMAQRTLVPAATIAGGVPVVAAAAEGERRQSELAP